MSLAPCLQNASARVKLYKNVRVIVNRNYPDDRRRVNPLYRLDLEREAWATKKID